MITLYTRDGRKSGNAIIIEQQKVPSSDHGLLIETDFGNRMTLSAEEVNELFTLGELRSYAEWRADRGDLVMQHYLPGEPYPVPAWTADQ